MRRQRSAPPVPLRLPERRSAGAVALVPLAATLVVALLAVACASPGRVTPYDQALRQIHQRRGDLAWDGLVTGMTLDQVERAVGERLPIPSGPDPLCERYTTPARVVGQPLRLSFSGTTGGARLRSITVILPYGFEVAEVAERLKDKFRNLEWVPSRHAPGRPEASLGKRLYRTPAGGLIFLDPRDGVTIGEVCVD